MNLLEYLFYKNISKAQFARELNITRVHLSQALHGNRKLSMKICRKAQDLTNGKIKAEDLRQFCIDAQTKRKKNERRKSKSTDSQDKRRS